MCYQWSFVGVVEEMALVSHHTGTGNIVAGPASMYAGPGAAGAAAAAAALAKESSRHSTGLNGKSVTAKLLQNSYHNGHLSQVYHFSSFFFFF